MRNIEREIERVIGEPAKAVVRSPVTRIVGGAVTGVIGALWPTPTVTGERELENIRREEARDKAMRDMMRQADRTRMLRDVTPNIPPRLEIPAPQPPIPPAPTPRELETITAPKRASIQEQRTAIQRRVDRELADARVRAQQAIDDAKARADRRAADAKARARSQLRARLSRLGQRFGGTIAGALSTPSPTRPVDPLTVLPTPGIDPLTPFQPRLLPSPGGGYAPNAPSTNRYCEELQRRKRQKRRKCKQRANVVWASGPLKGRIAGTRCLEFE